MIIAYDRKQKIQPRGHSGTLSFSFFLYACAPTAPDRCIAGRGGDGRCGGLPAGGVGGPRLPHLRNAPRAPIEAPGGPAPRRHLRRGMYELQCNDKIGRQGGLHAAAASYGTTQGRSRGTSFQSSKKSCGMYTTGVEGFAKTYNFVSAPSFVAEKSSFRTIGPAGGWYLAKPEVAIARARTNCQGYLRTL